MDEMQELLGMGESGKKKLAGDFHSTP